ncbi:hypothetical protein P7F88_09685 [Vibrio hannami]|uniref:ABC transporter substrate-binding protein n=1 Tax=Vibrio hannami TaxID=2717094 RepID=UPI00240F371C|nr:hypothetical protein [Vibrio hannami]MDG3086363.1 hypothetical protein [Vibrio hannami]
MGKWIFLPLFYLSSALVEAGTILVVESYHSEYVWDKSYTRGLNDVLADSYELVHFEMDTKRIPESEFQKRADSAWSMYKKISPDLVVLADDNSLKYLGHKFVDTQVPVVYLGINANPRAYGVAKATNFSGVLERPLFRRSILMLNEVSPMEKALLLLDSGETSKVIKNEMFFGKDSIVLGGTHVDIKLVSQFEEWQELVLNSHFNGYDVVIPALYHTISDISGNYVPPEHVIEWTSQNTPIPPFGFWDFSIGHTKNIGGYVVSGYEQGAAAGKIARKALEEGERIRPLMLNKGQYVFSTNQLKRWAIKLPEHIASEASFID